MYERDRRAVLPSGFRPDGMNQLRLTRWSLLRLYWTSGDPRARSQRCFVLRLQRPPSVPRQGGMIMKRGKTRRQATAWITFIFIMLEE